MYKFIHLAVMVAFMATPGFALGKTLRDAVGICPGGTEMRVPRLECQPGKQIYMKVTCPTGEATFRVDCPEEFVAPTEAPLRAFLVLDMSVTGGAFGLGKKPVTGGGQATLGLEFRLTKVVGLQMEGRIGALGNFWDCQKVKASILVGGAALLTLRPHDIVRLGIGVGGMTVRDSSWVTIVDGMPGVLRLDVFFFKDLGFRVQGEVGPGWDAAHQLHTLWSATGGFVYSPAILNKGK